MAMNTEQYIVQLLVLLQSSCCALRCQICEHMGGLSVVPRYAPRSRLIFNVRTPTCDEAEVECHEPDAVCFSGLAEVGFETFWVHKGCLRASSVDWTALRSIPNKTNSYCVSRRLGTKFTAHFPTPVAHRTVDMRVCGCNTGDYCNSQRSVGEQIMTQTGNNHAVTQPWDKWMFFQTCLLTLILFQHQQ